MPLKIASVFNQNWGFTFEMLHPEAKSEKQHYRKLLLNILLKFVLTQTSYLNLPGANTSGSMPVATATRYFPRLRTLSRFTGVPFAG